MTILRAWLGVFLAILAIYTAIVIGQHGWGLLQVFFGDMMALNWPGQFNLDFLGFLLLSALWVAWRHQFSAAGLALAPLALFGGMGFLTVYLIIVIGQVKGDPAALLIGPQRAAASG